MGSGPPSQELKTVAGVVGLPAADTFGPVEANPNPSRHQSQTRLYAKQPLTVRAGQTFDLFVPPKERGQLAIGWGNSPTTYTWRLHVSCQHSQKAWPHAKWLAFAGGYFVSKRRCATLIVRYEGHDDPVRIGVGATCASN